MLLHRYVGSIVSKYYLINSIIFITLLLKINKNWRNAAKICLLSFLQLDVCLIKGGWFQAFVLLKLYGICTLPRVHALIYRAIRVFHSMVDYPGNNTKK